MIPKVTACLLAVPPETAWSPSPRFPVVIFLYHVRVLKEFLIAKDMSFQMHSAETRST